MNAPAFRVAAMPGDPGKPNEDLAGVLGGCAVLIDGSGAPGDLPTGCVHGVPWYVRHLAARCLAGMVTSDQGEPLAAILAGAITQVTALHSGTCDLTVPGTPSAVLALARTTAEVLDYLVLGDTTLLIEHVGGGLEEVTDRRMGRVAQAEYQAVLALPTGTPEHQAARVAYVRAQQPYRNQPGGYPVASTDPASAWQAVTGTIPAGAVRSAAMMSDGVSRFAEFGLGTWADLLDVLASDGPDALFARIRDAEDTDPDGRRWPRAKKHDDVSVVFCEAGERSS